MEIRLLEIQYKNIREMKDLVINLCEKNQDKVPKPVSLIQMPNGVGKTTTMELIRYCLDGSIDELDGERILSFKPPHSDVDEGKITTKFSINDKIIFLEIVFDYESGKAEYRTSMASEKSGGREAGHNLPREIQSIMNKKFVRLFVFDGELAGELLRSDMTSAEEAIRSLYHLDKIRNLAGKLDAILDDKINKVQDSGVKTGQGKKQLQSKLKSAREAEEWLLKEITYLKEKKFKLDEKIKGNGAYIKTFRKKYEVLDTNYDKLKAEIERIEKDIVDKSERIMAQMRHPYNISDDIHSKLKSLSKQMVSLKLPRAQSTEFFRELAEGSECICGRPIKEEHKEIIIQKSKEFLTEDDISVINAIKSSVRNLPNREKIELLIEENRELADRKKRKEQDLSKVNEELKSKGSEKLNQIAEQLEKNEDEWKELERQLRVREESDKTEQESFGLTWRDNIHICQAYIENLKKQLAEATNTVNFKKKVDTLKEIIDEIDKKSMAKLKDYIVVETNKKISQILHSNDIQISKIGTCLVFKDRMGVSEGQKLSVAYAFLSTLFHESPHKLPFIVDTPAAPLDLSVRREVANTIPKLFPQIVVFITSGERNGFADSFYSQKEKCHFFTIRKDGSGVAKLDDDLEYFKKFQSEV